jgi:cystathionine gamma-synthase
MVMAGESASRTRDRASGFTTCVAGSVTDVNKRDSELGLGTRCVHGDGPPGGPDASGAVSFPIYQSATFARPGLGEGSGFDYSRLQNPTRQRVEEVICALEGGSDALAFTSGMAAISVLLELFSPGDHLIVDSDLYGGTNRMLHTIAAKNGLDVTFVDCSVQAGTDLSTLITERTAAIFVETPTNPMMRVVDLAAAAAICREAGALFIVDNTFLTPYLQNPLSLGADVVVHSGTKYLGGHNDTLAGFLVTGSPELAERLRYLSKTIGAGLAPFDAWLIMRGAKTLALRMRQAQATAGELARWLTTQPQVAAVHYPGLPDHPGHEVCARQARGFGAMISFEMADDEAVERVLRGVRLIQFAESLGGVESLITYPIAQTHADVAPEVLAANGITPRLLRLSVGIEDVADLEADLRQAWTP